MIRLPRVDGLCDALRHVAETAVRNGHWRAIVPGGNKGDGNGKAAGGSQCVIEIHLLPPSQSSAPKQRPCPEGLINASFEADVFFQALGAFTKSPYCSKCKATYKECAQYIYRNLVLQNVDNVDIKVSSVSYPDSIVVQHHCGDMRDSMLVTLAAKQRHPYCGFPSKSELHDERLVRKMMFKLPLHSHAAPQLPNEGVLQTKRRAGSAASWKPTSLLLCFEDYDNADGHRVCRIYFVATANTTQEAEQGSSSDGHFIPAETVVSMVSRACREMGLGIHPHECMAAPRG